MKKIGEKYQPKLIEKKWQKQWEKDAIYRYAVEKKSTPYYTLVELPYPSGDLHLGHWFSFVCPDAHARYMRMSGKNVFFPNGFDAFGLPAENAAIKRQIHPKDWTMRNIETMKVQFATMGTMIDWSHEAITCLPEYYKWNQWIFIKMFEKGIAYRGKTLSNWCPVDQTVLANEHVEDGKCWRCGSVVEQKEVAQWFLKITAFADELLWDNVEEGKKANGVDWPKSVKEGQNNWIGKSEGAEVSFAIKGRDEVITVFTTRPDTLYGATFLVVAPEHPVLGQMVNGKWQIEEKTKKEVLAYLEAAKKKTEMDRKEQKEKTGVFSGLYAVHPLTREEIPVWVADYVLWGYGTGAIMAVPGHDERDFAFAKKFELGVKQVISPFNNCIIVHGCPDAASDGSQNNKHWLGWLEGAIKSSGLEAISVQMPTPWDPNFEEWKKEFEKHSISEETILIGHSCGAAFLVRWLLETRKKVKKLILVAPAKIPDPKIDRRIDLYNFDLNGDAADVAKERVIFISNDEERHLDSAELYKKALNARVVELKNMGHFVLEDMGKEEFPELFDELFHGNGQIITHGKIMNSGDWNDFEVPEDIGKVIDWLEEKKLGKRRVEYHLHDWSISRQRYWGTPVPMIHCPDCGIVPVPLKDLPIELPYEVDYAPKGKPPLATAEDWLKVSCPKCGGEAKRDAETLDTFFDSSWYYYRYMDPDFTDLPFSTELAKKLMPLDVYFGGAEHTLGHTLYARFFTKFFKQLGLVDFDEFAKKRVQHGVILGPDGNRMSKSKGNVVNPDDVVTEYGADTVRLYLCFMMPYEATAPWNPTAISGIFRFLRRIWDLSDQASSEDRLSAQDLYWMHKTIKKVGEDLGSIKFNTAVSALMEWLNYLTRREAISREEYATLILLISPFAPHIAEELWQFIESRIKNQESSKEDHESIHLQSWPKYEEKYLVQDEVTIVIQVNGKIRDTISISSQDKGLKAAVEKKARESERVKAHLEGKSMQKVIYIEGKLLNFVVPQA